MNGSVGEAAIPPQTQMQVAPDAVSQQGQAQIAQKLAKAQVSKQIFDAVLSSVADKIGATFSSRIKQPETVISKITQKRIEGRSGYGIDDVGDYLGGRINVKSDSDIPEAKKAVETLAKAGVFKINKAERVKHDVYDAWHYDLDLPTGSKMELQVHTVKSASSAIVNHDLRSLMGEKLSGQAEQLRDKQHKMIQKMPNQKADAVSQTIQQLRTQNNNKPIPPQITAQILQQAGGGVSA